MPVGGPGRYRAVMRPMQIVALPFAVLGIAGLARGELAQGLPFLVLAATFLLVGRDAEDDEEEAA